MTLAQLRTLVLSLLDDPDGGYFTNAQTLVFINNAQQEVQKMISQAFEGYFLKAVSASTVQNQREYQLPSDFKRLHRLELVLSGSNISDESFIRLKKITRNQQDLLFNNAGTPEGYFFQGDYMILIPAPDSAKTMRMYYEYRVPDLSADGDVSEIPIQHHEMIAILAARDGMIKDGRDASLLQKKIDDFMKTMKQDSEQRNADEPRTIVQTVDDDFEGFW